MAVFKACVKSRRADGYYKVYIRVTHNRKIGYIPTTMFVNKLRKGEICDSIVLGKCAIKIQKYVELLNSLNTIEWEVSDIVACLQENSELVSFTEYAKVFVDKMILDGRVGASGNYKTAVQKLLEFSGKKRLLFSDITSKLLNDWIESLKHTSIAKTKYPKCIKTIFKAGCDEFNDYDRDIIKIRNRPFKSVKIPNVTQPEKKAIEKNELLKFFRCDLGQVSEREIFAREVCLLSFCLVGMNTADLYDVDAECLKENWKLCYNRKKTRDERGNNAYIEITVPQMVRHLFEKYKGTNGKLFSFSERYSTANNFNKYVNQSCKRISEVAQIVEVSTYTFRHSWATFAQNNCNASTELVAFSLNHSSAHKVTEGYIKKDYTPIDKLNAKVLKKVFG